MKRLLHLIGPYAGQVIDMPDAVADAAVTDSWGRLVANQPYPYNSSGVIVNRAAQTYPNSLKIWLAAIEPIPPYEPSEEFVPVVAITKAMPGVIEVGPDDIEKFSDGDFVRFFRTGTILDTSFSAGITNVDEEAFTFEVQIDLTNSPNLLPTGVVINLST